MLPPATTLGQVRCKIMGPSCGRLAMERHLMSFDAMNRGYSKTPPPHSCQKKWNISFCVKNGTKCALVTDDQLVYHSLQYVFPQSARLLPMLETSKGPGSGYAPAFAHFRTRFCLQVNFETKISCPGRPLLHTHKGVVGEGALQCIHLVLVLLVGCAHRACRALITVLHKSSPHTFLDC
jgi:hypothetical protein